MGPAKPLKPLKYCFSVAKPYLFGQGFNSIEQCQTCQTLAVYVGTLANMAKTSKTTVLHSFGHF